MGLALSLRETADCDPDALHREAGRPFARPRIMDAQGGQPATARRRVRDHLRGEEGSDSRRGRQAVPLQPDTPHCPGGAGAVGVPGIFMARVTCPLLASDISTLNFSRIVAVAWAYWTSALA